MPDFRVTSKFTITASAPISQIAFGDITGDGRADLIVNSITVPTQNIAHPVLVYTANTDGSFTNVTDKTIGGVASSVFGRQVLVADFNGDGRSDFFIAGHGYDAPPFPGEQSALLLSTSNGGVTNATARLPQGLTFNHSAAMADVDGDGDLDILAGNSSVGGPSLWINNGGSFTAKAGALPSVLATTRGFTYAFLDANRDGIADLYAASGQAGPSRILIGDGKGNFKDAGVNLPAQPAGVEEIDTQILDLNGDGLMDILATGYKQGTFTGIYTRALIQKADGSFVDETAARIPGNDLSATAWRERINLADLDGDGDLDAVVQYSGTNAPQAEIWTNTNGVFKTSALPFEGGGYARIAVGDVDGNGTQDVIAVRGTQAQVLTNTAVNPVFQGSAQADAYIGNGFGNVAFLGAGNDTANGKGGNDTIDGGTGTDTLILAGNRSAYALKIQSNGIAVTGPDGSDVINRIEQIQFGSGETVSITSLIASQNANGSNPVFRFYNTATGVHFYSASETEALTVMANLETFQFEGAAFRAAATTDAGQIDIFRFFNKTTGTHFYTGSVSERDQVRAAQPNFTYEGVAYKAYAADSGPQEEVYRFYNKATGTHFYTASEGERDAITASMPNFAFEGIAFWTLL
jgi:hypothetical protein